MRKKNKKLIILLSSIFGVFALCGIFACSCFGKRKDTTKVNAENDTVAIINNQVYYKRFTTSSISGVSNTASEISCNLSLSLLYEYVSGEIKIKYLVIPTNNVPSNQRISFVYNGTLYSSQNYLSELNFFNDNGGSFTGYLDTLPSTFSFRVSYFRYQFISNHTTLYTWQDNIRLGFQFSFDNFTTTLGNSGTTRKYNYGDLTNRDELYVSEYSLFTNANNFNTGVTTSIGGQTGQGDFYSGNIDYSGYNPAEEQLVDSYNNGYENGYANGYTNGYVNGNSSAESSANAFWEQYYNEQLSIVYQNGYSDGYNVGHTGNQTALTVFSGILQIAMVPINFFLACFNFEILGINLSAFIRALLTVGITIIVVKFVLGNTGGKSN